MWKLCYEAINTTRVLTEYDALYIMEKEKNVREKERLIYMNKLNKYVLVYWNGWSENTSVMTEEFKKYS